jgi:putative two-component system response regulator
MIMADPATQITRAHRVLIVDDDPDTCRTLARAMRRFGHEVEEAHDGFEGLARLDEGADLVLLDVNMPGMDGFGLVRRMRSDARFRDVPVMMVTGQRGEQNWRRALDAGASDFIGKPMDVAELQLRSTWLLRMKDASDELQAHKGRLEELVDARTAALREALDEAAQAQQQTWDAHLDTVRRLVLAAEYRDGDTAAHIERIGCYAGMLAESLRLPPEEVELARLAAPMHDVGKIGIPDHILLKPGPLTAAEWEIMRTHPVIGANILDGSPSPVVQAGRLIALTHHEQWDGGGYPRGLMGEAIPLLARICAVVDMFDALTTSRPYRAPVPVATAIALMQEERGRQFDPYVLDTFLRNRAAFATALEEFTASEQGAPA